MSSFLSPNIFQSTLFSNTHNLFFPQCRRPCFTLMKRLANVLFWIYWTSAFLTADRMISFLNWLTTSTSQSYYSSPNFIMYFTLFVSAYARYLHFDTFLINCYMPNQKIHLENICIPNLSAPFHFHSNYLLRKKHLTASFLLTIS